MGRWLYDWDDFGGRRIYSTCRLFEAERHVHKFEQFGMSIMSCVRCCGCWITYLILQVDAVNVRFRL